MLQIHDQANLVQIEFQWQLQILGLVKSQGATRIYSAYYRFFVTFSEYSLVVFVSGIDLEKTWAGTWLVIESIAAKQTENS